MKIRNLTYISLMTAIICVISPFSIPFGAVPVSLSTFAIYLASGILGFPKGTISVLIYLLLGAVGLPVFSNFEGGFQKIAGLTGGYLIGYIPCSIIVGIMTVKLKKFWSYPISMVIGTAICYLLGILWLMYQTKIGFYQGCLIGVLPFLLGDLIKILFASVIGFEIRKRNVF